MILKSETHVKLREKFRERGNYENVKRELYLQCNQLSPDTDPTSIIISSVIIRMNVKNRTKSRRQNWLTFILCDNIIGFPSALPINPTGAKVRQDTKPVG